MIAIENLSKSYGGQSLFEDVSVKINSRERMAWSAETATVRPRFFE